ncbi:MAG: nucleotidyltransferase domain-containing protein [bacterium]|nr:nucleotidyltransferase domain-containing protein [bacterium]
MKNLTQIEKRALKDVQKILPQKYGDNLILLNLFGSKARGDSQLYSDLDLLAVVEKDSWQAAERMSDDIFDIIEKYDYELLISLIVLDSNEFDFEKKIRTCFYENIEREGVELWKKN